MDIDPVTYNKINTVAKENAQEEIQGAIRVLAERADIIVDAGCGTGDTTLELAAIAPTAKVLGFDINPAMVAEARAACGRDSEAQTVDFFVEDVSGSWEEWNPKLLQVAGQVDLVWANLSLHWVPLLSQKRAVENLVNLLKPGGSICCTVFLFRPSEELDQKLPNVFQIPSIEVQTQTWINYFETCGVELEISKTEAFDKSVRHLEGLTEAEASHFTKPFFGMSKPFMSTSLSDQEKNDILRDFSYVMDKSHTRRTSTGKVIVTIDNLNIRATRI